MVEYTKPRCRFRQRGCFNKELYLVIIGIGIVPDLMDFFKVALFQDQHQPLLHEFYIFFFKNNKLVGIFQVQVAIPIVGFLLLS